MILYNHKREIKERNTKMYTVIAHNHFRTVNFEESYLEFDLALFAFNTATKCADCENAILISALTGEIIMAWDYDEGLTV